MKKYEYKGLVFQSETDLRKYLFENEKIVLGKTTENEIEFWSNLGVSVHEEITVVNEPPLEELKIVKLGLLNSLFETHRHSRESAFYSSLGFQINANVEAFNNITGLLAQLLYEGNDENQTVSFMSFNDKLLSLTVSDLRLLQSEISKNGTYLYGQKWVLREQINNAQSKEELENLSIQFVNQDFRK